MRGIAKYGDKGDCERNMAVRKPARNSSEVIRIVVDADVLDTHHRTHFRRVINSQNVMEKIAENQVTRSFAHIRKRLVRKVPKASTPHDVGTGNFLLIARRGDDFSGFRVLDRDDIQVVLGLGQQGLFIKNRPVIEVAAVLNKAEAVMTARVGSGKKLIDMPAQPGKRLIRGPNVSKQGRRDDGLKSGRHQETCAIVRQLSSLVLADRNEGGV